MTNNPSQPDGPAFLNNPHAPDLFADTASGWFAHAGNVRITFESFRVNHISSPGPIDRVVIGRLVMPIEAVEGMARGLLAFIEQQRSAPDSTSQSTPTLQ